MPKYIILHHTGGTDADPLADTSNQTFEVVNAWHRQNPNVWLGKLSSLGYAIGYTYFIDKTGKLTQGRSDTEQSAHTQGYNNNPWDVPEHASIGICLAGNFDLTFPSQAQIATLKSLLTSKMIQYSIPIANIVPHRTFANKTCYGRNLPNNWGQTLVSPPAIQTSCLAQEKIIAEQKVKIAWYESLVNSFIKTFLNK